MSRPWPRRDRARPPKGQVLVVFALTIIALFAFAGLAFDIGRFYSERRFLQNAADAGALAAANALIRGETTADAEAEARDVLARNFLGSPNGSNPSLPPSTPVYESGHAGDPDYLVDGILISGGDVRVAVRSDVGYTFGRVVGLGTNTIGARARVKTTGDLLPIAVRHYINAPGPSLNAVYPCDGDPTVFQDLLSTADTSCLGSESDDSLRTEPTAGLPFDSTLPNNDPSHHGPIITLVGQGAAPSNAANFRGFITLDIRNFQSEDPPSNVFYNGVTAGMNANTLKAFEAAWVASGYPGPDFPPAVTPPDPNNQVGILDGNSAGIVVEAIGQRYRAGDEVLAAVYSGTVMEIPDFAFTVPGTVSIGATQNRDGAVTMTATKNNAFAGQVTPTAFTDWGDPTNPYGTTLSPLTFSPDPATPPATITWDTFNTTGAPTGIYTIWIQGHSPSPYLRDHYYPVAVNIGNVQRDFSSTGSGLVMSMATTGATASGSLSFTTSNQNGRAFNGIVDVSVEGGPQAAGVLPTGIGSISVSPSSFDLDRGETHTVNITINGGTLSPGIYPLTVRATGTNSAGDTVTRHIPITLTIATAATSDEYVDITGFAVFRITSISANSIDGYAITGMYADMNDPQLRRGQVARLVPWT
jgi:hypothetical protein